MNLIYLILNLHLKRGEKKRNHQFKNITPSRNSLLITSLNECSIFKDPIFPRKMKSMFELSIINIYFLNLIRIYARN